MADIRLWWIGERHPAKRVLDHVRLHLERAFGAPVAVWEGMGRPDDAFDPRRKQWSSSRILSWLVRSAPDGKVLGVTDVDLFVPILTFVFGEAQLGGRAAVISSARLRDAVIRDERLVLERLAKESVHEMGHVFGLRHCGVPRCVMGRSVGVQDVDEKHPEPCPLCRERLARGVREPT